MASSSVGSDVFAILALAAISLIVLLLLRHFLPLRASPAYLTFPVFLALALPISIILLVPIDLASSVEHSRGVIWLPHNVLLLAWRLTYWLTFALTWFILPFLGEYVDSGYRSPRDRFLYSLRSNGRYYMIVVTCAAAGGIYVFLVNGFKTGSIKSLVMALAYCWGLILAIYLMGHGLVALPRRLLRSANIAGHTRRVQCQAARTFYKLNDAKIELEELEANLLQLQRRKNAVSRDHEEWIEEISDAAIFPNAVASAPSSTATSAPELPAVITDRYLAELSRNLMRARHKFVRFQNEWQRVASEGHDLQLIIEASSNKQLDFGRSTKATSWFGRLIVLTPRTRYFVYTRVLPSLQGLLGFLFAVASLCLVWSELVKAIAPRISIISLSILGSNTSKEARATIRGQVVASLWLCYMSFAALSSFSDVKIWGNRALVRRNTYAESATWYSSQVAKLTVPLAYNFLTCLQKDVSHSTTFYKFLGVLIDLTPLGKWFDIFFPLFILVPVCATLFNLYGRVTGVLQFGFNDEEDGDDQGAGGGWREGRDLIKREYQMRNTHRIIGTNDAPSSVRPSAGNATPQPHAPYRDSTISDGLHSENTTSISRGRRNQAQPSQSLAAATAAAEEEDESIFSGFAHRLKNTVDSFERPAWLEELGNKRPKWLRSDTQDSSDISGSASRPGLSQWFGGRSPSGRVRL